MTLLNCLAVAALVFSIGLACVVVHRNAVRVLMGIELMLNAVNINLASINYFRPSPDGAGHPMLTGQLFVVFVITVAAAEAAVGLAIVIAVYRNLRTINVDQAAALRR